MVVLFLKRLCIKSIPVFLSSWGSIFEHLSYAFINVITQLLVLKFDVKIQAVGVGSFSGTEAAASAAAIR